MGKGDNIFYACDPDLNTTCSPVIRKELCHIGGKCRICDGTFNPDFARKDENGNPMTYKQWKELQKQGGK